MNTAKTDSASSLTPDASAREVGMTSPPLVYRPYGTILRRYVKAEFTCQARIDRSVGYDRCMQSSSAATALAKSSRREEILQIAARLFAENGYHGTGIAELGEAVGLGKGALYHHIGSKEDLLYEISSRHV